MQELQFEYFHGMESQQYSFYRVPKILFTAKCFASLSCEAKVLYGLMLDRMSLSLKNRWFDEEDRVYIIFTVEEIAELLNCGTQKAVKLIKELDSSQGIGLIEKKRLGLGRPNVIYVKNFMVRDVMDSAEQESIENGEIAQNCENHNSRNAKITIQEFPKSQISNCENHHSRIVDTTNQELSKSQIKNSGNHSSGIVKTDIQEFPKSQSNKTEFNDTEYSETEIPIRSHPSQGTAQSEVKDVMEEMEACRAMIRSNISYESLGECESTEQVEVDELVELMVEVMMMADDSIIRIAGVDKPAAVVKNRYLKLRYQHIQYVLLCLRRNTTKIKNIRSYLLTTLYNSFMTVNHYYQAEVNHDLSDID